MMLALRILVACVVASALVACGSDESNSEQPDLSSALKNASMRLDKAGLDVEAQNVDVLAKTTPVLVVTGGSSSSALVAHNGEKNNLPYPAAGVPTNDYVVCTNGLVVYLPKGFEPERMVQHEVCAADS